MSSELLHSLSYSKAITDIFDVDEKLSKYSDPVINATTMPERWNALVKMYKHMTPMILAGERFDPYFIDWTKFFTPIESHAWADLRSSSMTFYPQYPVLNYFLDFADPIKKIGIELDGRQFHTPEKDKVRDAKLLKKGWQIYRIKGYESVIDEYKLFDEWIEIQENGYHQDELKQSIDDWLFGTSSGVIKAIQFIEYGIGELPYERLLPRLHVDAESEARKCLKNHCYFRR